MFRPERKKKLLGLEPQADEEYWSPKNICSFGDDNDSGGSQQVVQNSEPWSAQRPFLQNVYNLAQGAYGQTSKKPYDGPLTVNPNQQQTQALNQQAQIAGQLSGSGQEVINLGQAQARGDYLSPDSNPYLKDTVNAALRPIQQRFDTEVIPSLSSAAKVGGAYGNSQDEKFRALAAEQLGKTQQETAAKIYLDNYARERAIQQQSPGLINQGIGLQLAPTDILYNAGAQQRAFDQDAANNERQRFLINQQAPWQGLNEYASIIQGGYPGSSTSSTSSVSGPSTAQRVVSGGIGGAALGGLAANQLLGTTGAGALAPYVGGGAVLGGLLGGF